MIMTTEDLTFKTEELKVSEKGVYSSSRWLFNALSGVKIKLYSTVKEGVDYTFAPNKKGGLITLSTDVNAISLNENKIINWVKQKVANLQNKLTKDKKINSIGQKYNLDAWTVGKSLSGRYTAKNGRVFDENSISIEVIGIDSNELLSIAEELCIMFLQESVLVKDYSTGKVFLVSAE